MSRIANLTKPYREMGSQPKGNADFLEQDGLVFGWSESNLRYELAWWLYVEPPYPELVEQLRRERPLPSGEKMP